MLLKGLYFWLTDHAPWLIGRRSTAAFLNLRAVEILQNRHGPDPDDLERALALLNRGNRTLS